MGEEINKILIVIFTLAALVVSVGLLQSDYETTKWTQQKPISYPEEIYLAEPGDTLVVEKVSDSIYIQYK